MPLHQQHSGTRNIGRRNDDWRVRDKIARQDELLLVAQIITSEIDIDVLFQVIMSQTNQVMDSERSTVFLHDPKTDELWSLVATGMKRNEIRIPARFGVAGWVFQHRAPVLINEAYKDPRFFSEIDRKSGFHTRNIICLPLTNRDRHCIGALQTLNKHSGSFTEDDLYLLQSIAPYVTIALENARVYEQLKALDKAKERIMNHLSHELKTPIAIISGILERISKKAGRAGLTGLEQSIEVGQRNVRRLLQLQSKIDDILQGKSDQEKGSVVKIIEDALSFVQELRQDEPDGYSQILDLVTERIESIYRVDELCSERVHLSDFLDGICDEALRLATGREIEVVRALQKGVAIDEDRTMLAKVCSGLLKNAIENTPDEGRIEVSLKAAKTTARIEVQDYGVGVTEQNQELILGGFFHTQDTIAYSTKKPYDFNAGGSGSDLLRAKVFSERCGFSIAFESTRCIHSPADSDECPGRISRCPKVKSREECFTAGGTLFSLTFPRATH
jgi:signal transduction histidine kinase